MFCPESGEQGSYDIALSLLLLGYALLMRMACLSVSYAGITEPIKSGMRDPKLGIGKQEEDDYYTSEENIQRRKLEIEIEETEEQLKKREVCN